MNQNNSVKNNSVKFENNILTVPTPKGNIVITVKDDGGLYPGVHIDFESKDIKESVKLYDEAIQLATIEYNTVDKELATFIWDKPEKEDYSYKAIYNNFLIFDEDFKILPIGTKVKCFNKKAFIMGDDRDNCLDGYKDSLNYYIKYANDNETYEDVLKRIEKNKEEWYDNMELWSFIKTI